MNTHKELRLLREMLNVFDWSLTGNPAKALDKAEALRLIHEQQTKLGETGEQLVGAYKYRAGLSGDARKLFDTIMDNWNYPTYGLTEESYEYYYRSLRPAVMERVLLEAGVVAGCNKYIADEPVDASKTPETPKDSGGGDTNLLTVSCIGDELVIRVSPFLYDAPMEMKVLVVNEINRMLVTKTTTKH